VTASPRSTDPKESLALDVEALRRRLGPVKVALIEQWIREVNGPLDAAIGAWVHPQARVLDAGCSRGDPDLPSLQRGRYMVGSDVDLPGLRANTLADAVVLAPMGRLPFADASFDVVACKWVLEHLEHPERDFAECARVLKPGGALVALTPNAYSAFTLISRAIPYRLKQILKGNMFGLHEEDTFRTWYRANSPRQLRRLAAAAGFEEAELQLLPGMWTFFIFSAPLARLVRRGELLQMRVPFLRQAATYYVGVWRKHG
jgi:SAM-dependent methyltransferase